MGSAQSSDGDEAARAAQGVGGFWLEQESLERQRKLQQQQQIQHQQQIQQQQHAQHQTLTRRCSGSHRSHASSAGGTGGSGSHRHHRHHHHHHHHHHHAHHALAGPLGRPYATLAAPCRRASLASVVGGPLPGPSAAAAAAAAVAHPPVHAPSLEDVSALIVNELRASAHARRRRQLIPRARLAPRRAAIDIVRRISVSPATIPRSHSQLSRTRSAPDYARSPAPPAGPPPPPQPTFPPPPLAAPTPSPPPQQQPPPQSQGQHAAAEVGAQGDSPEPRPEPRRRPSLAGVGPAGPPPTEPAPAVPVASAASALQENLYGYASPPPPRPVSCALSATTDTASLAARLDFDEETEAETEADDDHRTRCNQSVVTDSGSLAARLDFDEETEIDDEEERSSDGASSDSSDGPDYVNVHPLLKHENRLPRINTDTVVRAPRPRERTGCSPALVGTVVAAAGGGGRYRAEPTPAPRSASLTRPRPASASPDYPQHRPLATRSLSLSAAPDLLRGCHSPDQVVPSAPTNSPVSRRPPEPAAPASRRASLAGPPPSAFLSGGTSPPASPTSPSGPPPQKTPVSRVGSCTLARARRQREDAATAPAAPEPSVQRTSPAPSPAEDTRRQRTPSATSLSPPSPTRGSPSPARCSPSVRASPSAARVSPTSSRSSPISNRDSLASSRASLTSARDSPTSARVSPTSPRASPTSARAPPSSARSSPTGPRAPSAQSRASPQASRASPATQGTQTLQRGSSFVRASPVRASLTYVSPERVPSAAAVRAAPVRTAAPSSPPVRATPARVTPVPADSPPTQRKDANDMSRRPQVLKVTDSVNTLRRPRGGQGAASPPAATTPADHTSEAPTAAAAPAAPIIVATIALADPSAAAPPAPPADGLACTEVPLPPPPPPPASSAVAPAAAPAFRALSCAASGAKALPPAGALSLDRRACRGAGIGRSVPEYLNRICTADMLWPPPGTLKIENARKVRQQQPQQPAGAGDERSKVAAFDGLLQYLQEYRHGLRELLVNNNVVIIEPVRGDGAGGEAGRDAMAVGGAGGRASVGMRLGPPRAGYAADAESLSGGAAGCRITGATIKRAPGGGRGCTPQGVSPYGTLPRQPHSTGNGPAPPRHFFYHPKRGNRELVDSELPDPDTVRNARQLFEKTLRMRAPSDEFNIRNDHLESGAAEATPAPEINRAKTPEVAPPPPPPQVSAPQAAQTPPPPPPQPQGPAPLPPPPPKTSPEKTNSHFKKKTPPRYLTVDSVKHSTAAPKRWSDTGSLSSGVSSDLSCYETDADSPSRGSSHRADGEDAFSSDEEDERLLAARGGRRARDDPDDDPDDDDDDAAARGHYVAPEVLEKIRACGTTVTYFGGRVVSSSRGTVLSPLTRAIMDEIRQSGNTGGGGGSAAQRRGRDIEVVRDDGTGGLKFRLVKSNSCGSRLELAGTEDDPTPLGTSPSNGIAGARSPEPLETLCEADETPSLTDVPRPEETTPSATAATKLFTNGLGFWRRSESELVKSGDSPARCAFVAERVKAAATAPAPTLRRPLFDDMEFEEFEVAEDAYSGQTQAPSPQQAPLATWAGATDTPAPPTHSVC